MTSRARAARTAATIRHGECSERSGDVSEVDRDHGGESHSLLLDLFCGLSPDELAQLREDVQFGRVSQPIVVEVIDD